MRALPFYLTTGLAILVFGLLLLLTIGIALFAAFRLFSWGSGWKELAARYAADSEPAGERFAWQHVRVGAVRYRNATTVVIAPQGLYLAVRLPNHPALLIPWSEISTVGPTTIYWRPFMQLAVGGSAIKIALPRSLYQKAQPYLP